MWEKGPRMPENEKKHLSLKVKLNGKGEQMLISVPQIYIFLRIHSRSIKGQKMSEGELTS